MKLWLCQLRKWKSDSNKILFILISIGERIAILLLYLRHGVDQSHLIPYFLQMVHCMGLLPDTQSGGLRMRQECRERFPHHRLQRKPLVNDPGMHHGTCVTHVPWCMPGSLTNAGGENVPVIPGACATRHVAYLVRGPCLWCFGHWHCLHGCLINVL